MGTGRVRGAELSWCECGPDYNLNFSFLCKLPVPALNPRALRPIAFGKIGIDRCRTGLCARIATIKPAFRIALSRSSQDHWEHYDHEADMGVRGVGCTKSAAFEQAALALTAVVTDPDLVQPTKLVVVECEAPDDGLLLFEWLNALVYEMAVRHMLFSHFEVEVREGWLRASMRGEPVERQRHHPATEVKGATMTTLAVYQDEIDRWIAQTVVDV